MPSEQLTKALELAEAEYQLLPYRKRFIPIEDIARDPLRYGYKSMSARESKARQGDFIADKRKIVAAILANRGGKTEAGAIKFLNKCLSKKGRAWSLCPSYDLQKAGTQEKILDYLKPEHIKRKSYATGTALKEIELTNGTLIEFKCHPKDQRVLMSTGIWKEIGSVEIGEFVHCADGINRLVSQKHEYKNAPILEIKTNVGNIKGTPNHPVFSNNGKKRMDELLLGDVLEIAEFKQTKELHMEDWEIITTALMIGDGCLRAKTPLLTTESTNLLNQLKKILPDDLYIAKPPTMKAYDYKISSKLHKKNRLKDLMVSSGLWNHLAEDKFIPNWVFQLSKEKTTLFLRWLWSCDGSINRKQARYTSCSKKLIYDVRALLWNIGISASVSQASERHYYIQISGKERLKVDDFGKIDSDIKYSVHHNKKKILGEVKVIETCCNGDVIGIGIEGKHELIVEGFRVGNTYEQGREKLQSAKLMVAWCDEEPSEDIYKEVLTRLVDLSGQMILTFTPLKGFTWSYDQIFNYTGDNVGVYMWGMADNPFIPLNEIDMLKSALTWKQAQMRLFGKYMGSESAVWQVFERRIHVNEEPMYDPGLPVDITVDPGVVTAAVLFGQYQKGVIKRKGKMQDRFVIIDAMELHDVGYATMMQLIFKRCSQKGYIPHENGWFIDPASRQRQQSTRTGTAMLGLIKQEFGIDFSYIKKLGIEESIEIVASYMMNANGEARFFLDGDIAVDDRGHTVAQRIEGYVRDEDTHKPIDDDIVTHITDTIRMWVCNRVRGALKGGFSQH